jgi:hypothetical protein
MIFSGLSRVSEILIVVGRKRDIGFVLRERNAPMFAFIGNALCRGSPMRSPTRKIAVFLIRASFNVGERIALPQCKNHS